MNKKILKLVKIILWGLVYTLPLWQFLLMTNHGETITLYNVIGQYIVDNNPVSECLFKIFGATGVVTLFNNSSGIIHYLAYFVYVSFAHICIDVILFLPDCARFIFDKMTGGKDEDTI